MSNTLYDSIREDIHRWRQDNYQSAIHEVSQILNYQFIDEKKTTLRYLRKAQFEAIETYLYLRCIKHTKTYY